MPHFIIDCSENFVNTHSPEELMQAVYDSSEATGIFTKDDSKVRIRPFKYYNIGNTKNEFIHIFCYMLDGRSIEAKRTLSESVVAKLKNMYPEVPIISMDIRDFERASYCNKPMV